MPKRSRRFEAALPTADSPIPVFTAGGYVRLSVDGGNQKSESIENQKQIIEEYVQEHNRKPDREFLLRLSGFYEDRGLSGTDFQREAFEALMKDARAGKINCIIVKDFSRLGRNFLDGCNYVENILPFLHIRLIAISDNYDSMAQDAADRRFEVRLKHLTNEMYALESSEKVTAVKTISQKKGSFIGSKCPYGYRAEWIDGIRTLVTAGDAAFEVQQIFSKYLAGASINDLIDDLYAKRVNRPQEWRKTGRTYAQADEPIYRWRRQSIQDLLRNAAYAGDMAQGKYQRRLYENQKKRIAVPKEEWIVVENTHAPLVSREDFVRASQRVNEELHKHPARTGCGKKCIRKNTIYENVFGDIIYCGDCGKRLGATYYQSRLQDNRQYRYHCRGAYIKDHRACSSKSISEKKLWEILRCIIRQTLISYGIRGKDLTQANDKAVQQVIADIRGQQQALLRQKASLEDAVQQAYFAMKRGTKTPQAYQSICQEALSKAKEYTDALEALEKRLMHLNRAAQRQNQFLRSLLKADAAKMPDRILVNEVVESIYLYEDARVIINLKIKEGEAYEGG